VLHWAINGATIRARMSRPFPAELEPELPGGSPFADGYTGTGSSTVRVAAGGTSTVTLAPSSDGHYDVTVTADVGDGFERRFAGRVYA
jgi:hypothetical protein